MYEHQKGIPPAIPKNPIDDHKTYTVRNKNTHYHSILSQLPLQRNPHLPSATVSLFSLPSANASLTTSSKTFSMTPPSTDKSKYTTYPRYTVIIRRFKSRSNVTQMLLYN